MPCTVRKSHGQPWSLAPTARRLPHTTGRPSGRRGSSQPLTEKVAPHPVLTGHVSYGCRPVQFGRAGGLGRRSVLFGNRSRDGRPSTVYVLLPDSALVLLVLLSHCRDWSVASSVSCSRVGAVNFPPAARCFQGSNHALPVKVISKMIICFLLVLTMCGGSRDVTIQDRQHVSLRARPWLQTARERSLSFPSSSPRPSQSSFLSCHPSRPFQTVASPDFCHPRAYPRHGDAQLGLLVSWSPEFSPRPSNPILSPSRDLAAPVRTPFPSPE